MNSTPAPSRKHGFMKSTWHLKPQSEWSKAERMMDFIQPTTDPVPPVRKGKLPILRRRDQWISLCKRAAVPVALQYVSQTSFGISWHPAFATVAYLVAYLLHAKYTTRMALDLAQKWGCMDGEVARDKVPDVKVSHLAIVFRIGTCLSEESKKDRPPLGGVSRILAGVLLLYDRRAPVTVSLLLPLKAFLYAILIDLMFYVYHRSSHEVDWLWSIHRTHHMTKHPTPALVILADEEQEMLEIHLIPFAAAFITSQLVPFSFHEWFIANCGIVGVELLGHSGVRANIEGFLTSPFLRPFGLGLELTLEDHDHHHRHGWRKAANYGKQSRLWDCVFGSLGERDEAKPDNIDWSLSVFDPVPESNSS